MGLLFTLATNRNIFRHVETIVKAKEWTFKSILEGISDFTCPQLFLIFLLTQVEKMC